MATMEHNLQYQIVQYLQLRRWVIIDCDIMDGLKYITYSKKQMMINPYKTNDKRYPFIVHHKKMGYRKGQPDMIAMKNGKVFCLELKAPDGRQSKEQKEFQQDCINNNINYLIVKGIEDLYVMDKM